MTMYRMARLATSSRSSMVCHMRCRRPPSSDVETRYSTYTTMRGYDVTLQRGVNRMLISHHERNVLVVRYILQNPVWSRGEASDKKTKGQRGAMRSDVDHQDRPNYPQAVSDVTAPKELRAHLRIWRSLNHVRDVDAARETKTRHGSSMRREMG